MSYATLPDHMTECKVCTEAYTSAFDKCPNGCIQEIVQPANSEPPKQAQKGVNSALAVLPAKDIPTTLLQFIVDGQPVAKQRPRTRRTRGGKYRTHTPKKTKDYEASVAQSARIALGSKPRFGDKDKLSVSITIWRDNAIRADIDNIVKSIMDGMEGIVYKNDSQVLELYARLHRKSDKAGISVKVSMLADTTAESEAA